MAELEVVKHTKKAYSIFYKDSSAIKKLKEFLLEIAIIVFAVTITIWFHDMAEHRHQQKEVKEFLIGLKSDLSNDLAEMKADRAAYMFQGSAFRFFSSMNADTTGVTDSLTKYTGVIFSYVSLQENNGRFEGFKSSGKIGNIEDKKLQNDILDMYTELIPALLNTTRIYNAQKDRLIVFVEQHARIDKTQKTLLLSETMRSDQAKIISSALASFPAEVIRRYDVCIARTNEIVKAIDGLYQE